MTPDVERVEAEGADDRAGSAMVAIEPRRLGRYTVRFCVGRGGMASVYLAQLAGQEGFRKWVGLKVIHPHIASDRRFVAMFLDEARLAARIDHPNVCTVFDFGEAQGTYFIAMEYLHGEPLNTLARRAWTRGAMPVGVAARIVADAARGLHAAHELRGADGRLVELVHRDVSPQNLFVLATGVAKVMDFGIAWSNERRGELTEAGEIKGKLAYLSPEQLTDRAGVDRRTDVWALGVVLWEIVVGRRLFKRETGARAISAVLNARIAPPREQRADCPAALDAIVMRALERDPARRFATAAELADALDAFLARLGTAAGPAQVAALVGDVCGDLLARRDAMLRRDDARVADPPAFEPSDAPGAAYEPAVRTDGALTRVLRRHGPGVRWLVVLGALGGAMALGFGLRGPLARTPTAATPRAAAPSAAPLEAPPSPSSAAPAPAAPLPIAAPPAAIAPTSHPSTAPTTTSGDGRPGFLDLFAVPSVQVFEDNRSLGFTPHHWTLPAGRHTLRLVPVSGGAAQVIAVVVRPGATTRRSVRPR